MQALGQLGRMYRFDGLIDRGGVRYAIKKNDLVETNGKSLVNERVHFFQRGTTERADDQIEVLILPKNAVDEVHGQGAVIASHLIAGAEPLEKDRQRPMVFTQLVKGGDGDES